MAACTLIIPSLISWTALPLLSTLMTLTPSRPSSAMTSSSNPPRQHPTAPATKAGTLCSRSGERCSRRRPRPGFPSRSSSPAAQDASSCAGATSGRTGTYVAWMSSGSEMASSPKAWPTSRASPERGPSDLGVDRKEQRRHVVSLQLQVRPAGPGQGRLNVAQHIATLEEPAPRPGHAPLNRAQHRVAMACPDVLQEEKPAIWPENPADFAERRSRVGHGTQDKRAHHGVDACVGQTGGVRPFVTQLQFDAVALRRLPER